MFHLLKRTVQPFKILFNNSNNTDFIKFSTINLSSTMSQSRTPFSNQVIANYSKRVHNGLILQVKHQSNEFVIQRKNVSKSSEFVKLSLILSKVGETVEKKYFYTWSKPDMTLVKTRGIIMLNEDSKIPPGEFLACDLVTVIIVVGFVLVLLSLVSSGPTDKKSKMNEAIAKMDKKITKAKIDQEYWTAVKETSKDIFVILTIFDTLTTGDMAKKLKVLQEVNAKSKEESSLKISQIKEKLKEMQKEELESVKKALEVLQKYGSIWNLTQEEKRLSIQNIHRISPIIKQCRKELEDVYALVQSLSKEDFKQNDNDTETKKLL